MTGFLAFLSWVIVFMCALIFDSVLLFIIWCAMFPFVIITILVSIL